ncbi:metallophosphoesterase [Candidatus Bathyarchaeota archaeon A05DMB-3]|nr:metallophosphoesterase [Candidatus Bathyarchaeota archaeon A05DMB-3]
MLLVHLSDLHCGPKFKEETFLEAIDEINALNPDVAIVTGDLTEDGLIGEFKEAKRYLALIKCKRLIVGSGNHDARTTGYLLFPKFFGNPSSVTKIDDIAIIMLNSSRPDRDDGEIGYNQGLWMKNQLENCKDAFKIIALHHHLIPVPDTGMERNIVSDAGDLLWTLTKYGFNLVLCGHRHRPWTWTLGKLMIIHAGTVSTDRLRGFYQNTYNIIQVEGEKIVASLKVVGGQECALNQVSIEAVNSLF